MLTSDSVLSLCSKAFPRKSSVTKTPRVTSDSDIQGSKDAVIQDLERKLRFKEERISNGQQVSGRFHSVCLQAIRESERL